jgi:type III pantothenate kinase
LLFAIDARNQEIAIGFFEKGDGERPGKLQAVRRISAQQGRSADEYCLLFESFAAGLGVEVSPSIGEAWMSCVVPSLVPVLRAAVRSAFGLECRCVGPGVRTGLRIRTDLSAELGSDLVCSAVAAKAISAGACVVVDFDAAIAFSAIGRSGEYLGTAIAPGLRTSAQSLRASAALLPEASLFKLRGEGLFEPQGESCRAIGKTTAESLRAGLCLGYAGLVDALARAQAEELVAIGEADSPEEVSLLASGAEEGRGIIAFLERGRFVPDLALEGLALIASRVALR